MAKKATKRTAKRTTRKAKPQARKVARPARVYRVRPVAKARKSSPRKIGSMKRSKKIGTILMNTLASGAGQFVGNYALGMMPASVGPLAGAGIVAAAGMAGDYVGVNSHLAAGMGGAGVNAAVSNLMDGAETPVNGIGRRRLSAADVKRIEAAARSRNISGLTDETLTGRDPVQARYNLF